MRLVVQYNDFSERLNIEPLLTYKINPFTKFYIGLTSRHRYHDFRDYSELENSE